MCPSVSTVLSARQKLSVLTESDLRTTVRDTILQATRGIHAMLCDTQVMYNYIAVLVWSIYERSDRGAECCMSPSFPG